MGDPKLVCARHPTKNASFGPCDYFRDGFCGDFVVLLGATNLISVRGKFKGAYTDNQLNHSQHKGPSCHLISFEGHLIKRIRVPNR